MEETKYTQDGLELQRVARQLQNSQRERVALDVMQDKAGERLHSALEGLRDAKPNDRSDKDRRYAITITELEKVLAYFEHWIAKE